MIRCPRVSLRPETAALEGHCPSCQEGGLGLGLGRGAAPSTEVEGARPIFARFLPHPLPGPSTEPPELGAGIPGRLRKPFCPIHKYFLSSLTSRQHTSVHSTCPETVRVGSSEGKKNTSLLMGREVEGEAFYSLRLPNVVRN